MALATPCKEWTGTKDKDGYGLGKYMGRMARTHRIAWMEEVGPIPPGLCVLHKCDNRACRNVEHLFLGTQQDNLRDMTEKGRRGTRAPAGELQARAKLTWAQVQQIRADTRTAKLIAADYGVSPTQIWSIKNHKTWKNGNGHMRNGTFIPAEAA